MKRTLQIYLTGSNQDGIGCSSTHLEMAVLKKLGGLWCVQETLSDAIRRKISTRTIQNIDKSFTQLKQQPNVSLLYTEFTLSKMCHFPSISKTKHFP